MLHIRILITSIILVCVNGNDLNNKCSNKWQGLLNLIPHERNLTTGCKITAILDSSHLTLYKGSNKIDQISLIDILAPIHIVPNSNECLIIHYNGKSTTLCSPNEYSRDSWWLALTQQLICQHLGKMRNEIAGETSLEEEREMEYENILTNSNQKGINIHIDDNVKNLPKISIHYSHDVDHEGEGSEGEGSEGSDVDVDEVDHDDED